MARLRAAPRRGTRSAQSRAPARRSAVFLFLFLVGDFQPSSVVAVSSSSLFSLIISTIIFSSARAGPSTPPTPPPPPRRPSSPWRGAYLQRFCFPPPLHGPREPPCVSPPALPLLIFFFLFNVFPRFSSHGEPRGGGVRGKGLPGGRVRERGPKAREGPPTAPFHTHTQRPPPPASRSLSPLTA